MLSLTFGLVAAVCWGLHDFIIRILKQPKGIYASIAAVLFLGCLLQSPVALLNADFSHISILALSVSVASGSFFALASISLYKAFINGPIKLVAPIVGGYPVFSLIFSSLNGNLPNGIQVGAINIIVICAGYVAASKEENEGALANKKSAILWAVLSSFGFASSFALGQYASNLSDQYALLLPNRISALMALLDAVAQGFVISSGKLEFPVYASISASLFGLVTILLAAFFLREKISSKQWIAILLVFVGLTILSY